MARRSPNSNRPVRPSSTPAKRKGIPLTPLAQKMLQDLQLAGHAERTQESYLRQVRKFAQWLHLAPDHDPYSTLVYAARGSDVVTTIVDGEILVDHGEPVRVSREEIAAEASAAAKELASRAGV